MKTEKVYLHQSDSARHISGIKEYTLYETGRPVLYPQSPPFKNGRIRMHAVNIRSS